jgi:hypothetical protein
MRTIRTHTFQWWITTGGNPFDTGARYGAELDVQYRPQIGPSSFFGHSWTRILGTSKLLGIEKPIEKESWLKIMQSVALQLPVDRTLEHFCDSMLEYSRGDDERCVLFLCLTLESASYKVLRMRKERKVKEYDRRLVKKAGLLASDTTIVDALFNDRGHIAHGAPARLLGKTYELSSAMSAVTEALKSYLLECTAYGWQESLKIH